MEYEITDVDYWENDAFIRIDGRKEYFQYSDKDGPSLGAALCYLLREGKIAFQWINNEYS